jgi:NodT family efflux transporter outer membrane factor (OMF) lipoprotein
MNTPLSRLAFAISAVAVASLTACTTVGPDYAVPKDAVANRTAASAPFAAANEKPYSKDALPPYWWRLYHDATLDKLIEKAFAANTDLRVAAANIAHARAVQDEVDDERRLHASANFDPAYGRPSGAALALPESLPNGGLYDTGVNVSYQLDLFGKIKRAAEAASANTEATQAAYDLARVTVAADTARAYVGACAAGEQLRVAQHSVDLQQQFVASTEQRQRVGRGTIVEVTRALSQLDQLRAALPPLQAQQRIAMYRLAVLTGEVPGRDIEGVAQCDKTPHLSAPIPVGDGAALLRRRPDIRQAERSLAGATARIGVATADLYPNISLGASVGSTGVLDQFGAANAFRWSVGPLISWTLPNTGSARSRIKQAQAGSDAALARFDATVLNALRETESALTTYARELDRNAALKAARDQSALASQQAHTLHRYGRMDFLSTLDADRTLANAESALAASNAQLANDQVGLFLALGGGWEQDEATGEKSPKQ